MLDEKILIYFNAAYFAGPYYGFGGPSDKVTYDKSSIFGAKCVVFHLPSFTELDYTSLPWLYARKRPGQIWVMYSLESAAYYRKMESPDFAAMFDLELSYRQCSDIWIPYMDVNTIASVHSAKVLPKRDFAVAFISSSFNKSGRHEYLKELMNYIPVHSYGTVLNNRSCDDVESRYESNGTNNKLNISAHYRFVLAFENSVSVDYVTEKFYQPLMVGSIPVYLGAPNVAEFAPAAGCYIDVKDFADPGTLAEHLLAIDDDAYQSWRRRPQTDPLAAKLSRLMQQGSADDALMQLIFGAGVKARLA